MVQLNKYLREIGIDEKYWLFEEEMQKQNSRYVPDEEGFVDAEMFNLNTSLSMYIYSQLCYFRDHCLNGYPGFMTFEQWQDTLDKMIEAFKLQLEEEVKLIMPSKNRQKKINYGMRLFIKYYNYLWY